MLLDKWRQLSANILDETQYDFHVKYLFRKKRLTGRHFERENRSMKAFNITCVFCGNILGTMLFKKLSCNLWLSNLINGFQILSEWLFSWLIMKKLKSLGFKIINIQNTDFLSFPHILILKYGKKYQLRVIILFSVYKIQDSNILKSHKNITKSINKFSSCMKIFCPCQREAGVPYCSGDAPFCVV